MTLTKKSESQVTGLQLKKDSEPEQVKFYFSKVFELKQSGKEFPINLDDIYPLVYIEKSKAVRALKSDFIENEDYVLLRQNSEQKNKPLAQNGKRSFASTKGGGHNRINYMLSISCMEYFIAKKVKPVFEVYRQVFHKTAEAKAEPKKLSENGTYIERDIFFSKLSRLSIKGTYRNGELWFVLNTSMKFLGYEQSGGGLYAKKYGENNCILIEGGKISAWFINMRWFDEFFKSTSRDIPYERITTLYRDLFKIEKSPSVDTPYTYHYTDKEILLIIAEINKLKQKPAITQEIIDKLMQGGGR